MDVILPAVGQMLEAKLVTELDYVNAVRIMTDFESSTLLTPNMIPAILISPVGEETEIGPVGNSVLRTFQIRIRIIAKSNDPNKYRNKLATKNIHDLSNKLRITLLDNKNLDTKVYSLRDKWSVKDLDVLYGSKSGHFNARDIIIEYDKIEAYTGVRNDQSTTAIPQGMIF